MQTMLLRVVSSGEMISVKSEKSENGVLNKRILVLQELGGKYENCYVVTVLGNLASLTFAGVCDTEVPDEGVQWAGVYGHRGNGSD